MEGISQWYKEQLTSGRLVLTEKINQYKVEKQTLEDALIAKNVETKNAIAVKWRLLLNPRLDQVEINRIWAAWAAEDQAANAVFEADRVENMLKYEDLIRQANQEFDEYYLY